MRVLIVDDHPLFRQGLRMLLGTLDRGVAVDEAGDLPDAVARMTTGCSDVAFLDLKLPGARGLGAIEELKRHCPDASIVIISGDHTPELVRESIERGASGFIPKSLSPETLIEAVTRVLDRKVYIPPDALAETDAARDDRFPHLTARQMEVLRLVIQGKTNKLVARELGLSVETVKTHLAVAMRALGAHTRTELVYMAARRGLTLG